jgi:hypothetical protein
MPVALMTVDGLGGLPQPSYRYGAPGSLPPPPPVQPVVLAVAAPLAADSPIELYALTV